MADIGRLLPNKVNYRHLSNTLLEVKRFKDQIACQSVNNKGNSQGMKCQVYSFFNPLEHCLASENDYNGYIIIQ
jgi:hypothetical protein